MGPCPGDGRRAPIVAEAANYFLFYEFQNHSTFPALSHTDLQGNDDHESILKEPYLGHMGGSPG